MALEQIFGARASAAAFDNLSNRTTDIHKR